MPVSTSSMVAANIIHPRLAANTPKISVRVSVATSPMVAIANVNTSH